MRHNILYHVLMFVRRAVFDTVYKKVKKCDSSTFGPKRTKFKVIR